MNTERLLNLINVLIGREGDFDIQSKLSRLMEELNNLAGAPQDPGTQLRVSEALAEVETGLDALEEDFDPAFHRRMEEIGAAEFFTGFIGRQVRALLADNQMTPAVVRDQTQDLVNRRDAFLGRLRTVGNELYELGFEEDDLSDGDAEIGFQIPRALFQNELGGLTKELSELRQIIRAFSELSGNAGESIEVRQISTSDPIFFFALSLVTIKFIGGAVTWSLNTWKTVEEIRQLRAQTSALKGPKTETLVEGFDAAIRDTIEEAVRSEAERLVGPDDGKAGRRNEMLTYLSKALEGILARVERGMVVELRLAPPPEANDTEADAGKDGKPGGETAALFAQLEEIQAQLVFPEPSDAPILKIEKVEAPAAKRRTRTQP